MRLDLLHKKHTELFEEPILGVRSPGRANIIGEHTDYNGGFVLPFAIDKSIYIIVSHSSRGYSSIYSADLDILEENIGNRTSSFLRYFQSVLTVLKLENKHHFNLSFGGNLPIGAGVSSSSAITCGFLAICNQLYNLNLSKQDMLQLASEAEHGVGVQGGMMDQFSILFGEKDKVLCLDCQDNSWFDLTIDTEQYEFVLVNSHVQHSLADTAYNERVNECKEGLRIIQSRDLSVHTMRDINLSHISYLPFPINHRIQHVVEENNRVKEAVLAIQSNDMTQLGKLLDSSHKSLSELYKVSCTELNFIVSQLKHHKEIAGARMMGGGFGGCVICLVEKNTISKVISSWNQEYNQKFGKPVSWFSIEPESGLQYISTSADDSN